MMGCWWIPDVMSNSALTSITPPPRQETVWRQPQPQAPCLIKQISSRRFYWKWGRLRRNQPHACFVDVYDGHTAVMLSSVTSHSLTLHNNRPSISIWSINHRYLFCTSQQWCSRLTYQTECYQTKSRIWLEFLAIRATSTPFIGVDVAITSVNATFIFLGADLSLEIIRSLIHYSLLLIFYPRYTSNGKLDTWYCS